MKIIPDSRELSVLIALEKQLLLALGADFSVLIEEKGRIIAK